MAHFLLIRARLKYLLLIGIPAGIAVGISLYYLLMPAWILIMRYDYDESLFPQIENRIEIQENDLQDFPALRQAILQADQDYPFGHTPSIGTSYLEGKKMVERFQMSHQYPPEYRAILIYKGGSNGSNDDTNDVKAYFVQIVFDYNRPLIQ